MKKQFLFSAGLSVIFALPLVAQTPTQEELNQAIREQTQSIIEQQNRLRFEQEQRAIQQREKTGAAIEYDTPKPIEKIEGPLPEFKITQIDLLGAEHLNQTEKHRLTQAYINTSMNLNTINELMRDITTHYINNGYVTTRVYIPKQNLTEGKLQLQVVEGLIEDLVYEGGFKSEIHTAFPSVKNGRLLNLRDIEQGLDQMNRLQSNHATMKLIPSEKTVGGTIIQITNLKTKAGDAKVRYDTYNEPQLKLLPKSFDLSKDNMLNINDTWTVRYFQKFKGRDQFSNSLSGDISLPFGHWTHRLSYSQFDTATPLVSGESRIVNTNQTKAYTWNSDVITYRDKTAKLSNSIELKVKETAFYTQDQKIPASSYRISVGNLGINYSNTWLSGIWNIGTNYHQGLPLFESELNGELTNTQPHYQYQKWTGDISYYGNWDMWGTPYTIMGSIHGENANTTLLDTERISIGDFTTVRGFSQTYTGDSGYYAKFSAGYNLSYLPQPFVEPQALTPFNWTYFIEGGTVTQKGGKTDSNPEGRVSLIGAGVSLRYTIPGLNCELTYAKPVRASELVPLETHIVYFSGTIDLY